MVYIIFLCIALPLVLMLPILDKRGRYLIGFFLIGTLTAVCAFEINSLLFSVAGLGSVRFTQTIPPITEEILKFVPVCVYALILSNNRRDVLPIAMSVGVGFAILENTVLLTQNIATVSLGWAALRGLSSSLMHGLCTMIVGAGLPYVRIQKKLFYTGTFGLWAIAVTLHGCFNLLIQSRLFYVGAALPMVIYVCIYLIRKKGALKLPFLSY